MIVLGIEIAAVFAELDGCVGGLKGENAWREGVIKCNDTWEHSVYGGSYSERQVAASAAALYHAN